MNDDDDADIWVWPSEAVDVDEILFPDDVEMRQARALTGEGDLLCEEGDPGFPDCWTGDPMISVDGAGGDDEISGLGDHGTGRPDGNWEDASPLDDGLPPEAELLPVTAVRVPSWTRSPISVRIRGMVW